MLCQAAISTVILSMTLLFPLPNSKSNGVLDANIKQLLPAMARVESRGDPKAIGDSGDAIGLYQIHRSYWTDAVNYDKTLGGTYKDCFDPDYARRVVYAYLHRYGSNNSDIEQLARIHNGGCNILKKQHSQKKSEIKAWNNTTKYWNKIKKEL
jgi:hypothetical protein